MPMDPDQIVKSLVAEDEMEDMKAYLERGRAFSQLAVDDLNSAWAAAFTAVAAGDDDMLLRLAELGAELRLRNLPLPEHRVQEALEAMRKRIAETKPESFDAVAERVAQLRQRREKKKH